MPSAATAPAAKPAQKALPKPDSDFYQHVDVLTADEKAIVTQVALQQGRYAGTAILRHITGQSAPPAFRYSDKGSMAVVGKGFALLQSGRVRASGRMVWLVWLAVHLWALAQPSLRFSVFVQWLWTLVTGQRGSRLIVNYVSREHSP
jgi:NADH dehydrogenase FAD-containing subunit